MVSKIKLNCFCKCFAQLYKETTVEIGFAKEGKNDDKDLTYLYESERVKCIQICMHLYGS